MHDEGLNKNSEIEFYSTEKFSVKPFVPFRSTEAKEWNRWLWLRYNPITYNYNRDIKSIVKMFKERDLVNKITKAKPSIVLSIDGDMASF